MLVAGRRSPSAACRRSIREVPGEQEFEVGRLTAGNIMSEAERSDSIGSFCFRTQFAIAREIVPEQKRRVPPTAFRPAAQICDLGGASRSGCKSETAMKRIRGSE